MISSYEDLINKVKLEKISMKELIEIINLNGFTKERLNQLLTLVTLSNKYSKIISKINISQIEKYIDLKIDEKDYYILLKYSNYFNSKSIKKLITNLLKDFELDYYCMFANKISDNELFQEAILNINYPEYIYEYASKVKNANIKLLEDKIIELNNISYLYFFARDIKGSNIKRLESVILKNNQDIEYLINFAELDNIDINKFEELILQSNNPYLIVKYANNPKSNLLKIEKRLLEIGNLESLLIFALNNRITDYTTLEDIFISLNSHFYIYRLASILPDKVNLLKLEEALLNSSNKDSYDENREEKINKIYSVYSFAKDLALHNIDISKLEDYIINSNDYYYIYLFYINVKNINKERLRNKLLEFKTPLELDILDYNIRKDKSLDVEDYFEFLKDTLNIKVNSLDLALKLIRSNLTLIIKKIGLVNLYLKLNNRYFKVKEEVLLYVKDEDILSTYSNFLNNDLSIELALELDKKFLDKNKSKVLKKDMLKKYS